MSGDASGSGERSRSLPRERGAMSPATMPKTVPDGLTSHHTHARTE
jgi:hypothetical protein